MSNKDMPRVIHACKTTIDHGDDYFVEHRDWWPVKIGGAVTSYTRTDIIYPPGLVRELIGEAEHAIRISKEYILMDSDVEDLVGVIAKLREVEKR